MFPNVHYIKNAHIRYVYQPCEPNTKADEKADSAENTPAQRRRTTGNANGLHSAYGAIARP